MGSFFKKKGNDKENPLEQISKSSDLKKLYYKNQKTGINFQLIFLDTMVDKNIIQESALPYLLEEAFLKIEDAVDLLPVSDIEVIDDVSKLVPRLLEGYVLLTIEDQIDKFCLFAAQKKETRSITIPEVEFSVVGPKEAFIESIDKNINLIRKRLPIKELVIEKLEVGKLSKTKIAILYIEGITNKEDVQTIRQRIRDIEFDAIVDSSYITQIISDNNLSPFPQILDTERPDRVSAILAEGKVAIVVDGSPHVLIAPTTLVEFFGSFEDYFLNWTIASFFRLLRVFAVIFSILITPLYVAVLTYHYELIPQDLIGLIITTRREIPFPPLLEVIFLEITIELLREAGARLPTKVGQTIGIVGGIVIGTASVEAGLTSNVLLILIALAALASFITPVYQIGNTIRLLRFPFLLIAQLWGLVGITFGICILLTHLLRLTSLGRPILEPIYPPRMSDLKDSIIRLSFNRQKKRPFYLRTNDKSRTKPKKDIDE